MSESAVRMDARYGRQKGLTVVPVADETAIFDRRHNRLHRLDPIATLVWARLDGSTSTTELVAGLASDFQAPREQVKRDVVVMLDRLLVDELIDEPDADGEDAHETDGELDEEDEEEPSRGNGHITVLRVPPTSCVDRITGLGWHMTDPLVVAGFGLGVRSSDEQTRSALQVGIPGQWGEALEVDANLSVLAARPTEVGTDLGRIYAECTLVARERSLEDLVGAARREVAGRVLLATRDPLACEVCVLDGPDGSVLAPAWWWNSLLSFRSALQDAGWEMVARHASLGSHDRGGQVGLPTLTPDGDLRLEWIGPVSGVLQDATSQGLGQEPVGRLASVMSVVNLRPSADPGSGMHACADIAELAMLRPEHSPEGLLGGCC